MPLSAHRKHKIYVAGIMGYGLGSEAPEEIAFYKKIKQEMIEDKNKGHMGVARED